MTLSVQLSSPAPLSVEQIEADLIEALRLWHTADAKGNPLQGLQLLRTLAPAAQASAQPSSVRQTSNQFLRYELEQLKQTNPEQASTLQLRFADDLAAQAVATRKNVSVATVWRWQQEGIRLIAEAIFTRETALRQQQQQSLLAHLPLPTYQQLFASERHMAQLTAQLLQPNPPWLVAIEGMGGMGKTALADALTRHLIAQNVWDGVAWVTAQARVLNLGGGIKATPTPALTVAGMVEALFAQLWPGPAPSGMSYDGRRHALATRLKSAPHLLVIDNLETLLDVESLLATLRGWVNPSKILLTTRQRLLSEADIFHFDLPQLGETDALRLVRAEAQTRNLPALLAASTADLRPIYAAVGGNPLALRLVVGQLHAHSLAAVLADLSAARGQPITNLYTYIYRQAWDSLSERQRQALLVMLLTAEQGETFAQLCTFAAGQLTAEELRDAIDHLLAFSLIDARGGLHERRYTIHSLTRSFLHRQVMKWSE